MNVKELVFIIFLHFLKLSIIQLLILSLGIKTNCNAIPYLTQQKHLKATKGHNIYIYFFFQLFCISRSVVNCTNCENAKQLEFVSRCPTGISESTLAEKRKQCENVLDDCPEKNTNPLVYHCVLHEVVSTRVEVCARRRISQGKTA